MKGFGSALIIIGVLLTIFKISGCENEKPSSLTDWMTHWGEGTEWLIKIGFIAVGIIFIAVAGRKTK